jgi:hypothetical protein
MKLEIQLLTAEYERDMALIKAKKFEIGFYVALFSFGVMLFLNADLLARLSRWL